MNTTNKHYSRPLWLTAILLTAFLTGCGNSNDTSTTDTTDPVALTVISTNPENADKAVGTNRKITATFSEPMDAATLDGASFTVESAGTLETGDVTLYADSNTAIFTPEGLSPSTDYTVTITTAAKSTTVKTMADDYVWSFTSDDKEDTIAPTVTETYPINGETDFYLNRDITASFSESLDITTVKDTSFKLTDAASVAVTGEVTYSDNGMVATFNPTDDLTAGESYTATLTAGIKDLAGNPLALETWIFAGKTTGLKPVNLGTAGDFAVLAKSGISTTGTTKITGDIGVSPIDLTAVTGFSVTMDSTNQFATSPYVVGKIYAADMATPTPTKMTTAISNMETAFTDAAGRTDPDSTELGAGNITGMTLTPGLYKWGTGVSIDADGVTISGSANDVWIFQIEQNLTVASNAIVKLEGGALAKNIFWQVGGKVTIGTTAQFQGVVLTATKIEVNTGATVNGRLLAQTAVTLDANAVTAP